MVVTPKISGKCTALLQAFRNRVETYKRRASQRSLAQTAGEPLLRVRRLWNMEMQSWEAVEAAWTSLKACVDAYGGDPNLIRLPDPPPPMPSEPGPPEEEDPQNGPESGEVPEQSGKPEKRRTHQCGATCKTVDHLCSRMTTNDGYCYQHA